MTQTFMYNLSNINSAAIHSFIKYYC